MSWKEKTIGVCDDIFKISFDSANFFYGLLSKNQEKKDENLWLDIFCEYLTLYTALVTRYSDLFLYQNFELSDLASFIFTHAFINLFPQMTEEGVRELTESRMAEANATIQFYYTPYEEIYPNPDKNNYDQTVLGQFSNRMLKVTGTVNPVFWFSAREHAMTKFLELLKKYQKNELK